MHTPRSLFNWCSNPYYIRQPSCLGLIAISIWPRHRSLLPILLLFSPRYTAFCPHRLRNQTPFQISKTLSVDVLEGVVCHKEGWKRIDITETAGSGEYAFCYWSWYWEGEENDNAQIFGGFWWQCSSVNDLNYVSSWPASMDPNRTFVRTDSFACSQPREFFATLFLYTCRSRVG